MFRILSTVVSCSLLVLSGDAQTEEGQLFPRTGFSGDRFGDACDIDGGLAVVGAPEHGGQGAVYVFMQNGSTWIEIDELAAVDGLAMDRFGAAVTIDAGTIVVGAPGHGVSGACYVFVQSGSTWTPQQKLTSPNATANAQLGTSVALQGDRAVAGAFVDNGGAPAGGAAFVFLRTGTTWAEEQKLVASGLGVASFSGQAVALDGTTIVVGGDSDSPPGGFENGAAWVWTRSGTTWSEQAKLTASDTAAFDFYGHGVAVSGDRAAIGSWAADTAGGQDTGAVYVYERTGTNWSETDKLVPSTAGPSDDLGWSVAFEDERIVAGARGGDSVVVFDRVGNDWFEQARFAGLDTVSGDELGAHVALDGLRVVAGAPAHTNVTDTGSAYVFALEPSSRYCSAKLNSLGCTPAIAGAGVASATSVNAFTIDATNVLNNKNGLLFHGINGPLAVPFLGGTLCVAPPLRRNPIQNAGGNPPPNDCSGQFSIDFNALIQGGGDPFLVPGQSVHAQWWSRDPGGSNGTGLSDAIAFEVGP